MHAAVHKFRFNSSTSKAEAGFLPEITASSKRGGSLRRTQRGDLHQHHTEINKMVATSTPSDAQVRLEFERMLPELTSRLRRRLFSTDPDLRDERTTEAVALSWATYLSARRRGRKPSASNLAWFCGHSVLSGRRLAGATSLDALAETRVARERIGVHTSLSEIGENAQNFYRVFGDRRCRWPLVDIVGTRLDWQAFLNRCDRRDQRIVQMKLDGHPQIEIADTIGVSPAFVSQRLRAIRQRWDGRAVA
jgi:hypothetical protein